MWCGSDRGTNTRTRRWLVGYKECVSERVKESDWGRMNVMLLDFKPERRDEVRTKRKVGGQYRGNVGFCKRMKMVNNRWTGMNCQGAKGVKCLAPVKSSAGVCRPGYESQQSTNKNPLVLLYNLLSVDRSCTATPRGRVRNSSIASFWPVTGLWKRLHVESL